MHIELLKLFQRLGIVAALVLLETACAGSRSIQTIDLQSKALTDNDKAACLALYKSRVESFMEEVSLTPSVAVVGNVIGALPVEEARALKVGADALRHSQHYGKAGEIDELRAFVLEATQREFEAIEVCPGTSRSLGMYFFAEALSVYLYSHGIDADETFSMDGLPTTTTDPGQRLVLALILNVDSDED